jgi:cytochrome c peroxidase
VLGDNFGNPVFKDFGAWKSPPLASSAAQAGFRASVMRGYEVFFNRPFWIRDSAHINTAGLGNPAKRTCVTCHNLQMVGTDATAGWGDLGTNNEPWADQSLFSPAYAAAPQLPLFKIVCNHDARPHPFLGRIIYTHDPGRALISGKCYDVGSVVMGQLRGLAARAPYFANGSAEDLRAVVDFYDRRFNMGLSEQERLDLVNFLSVL